MNSISTEHPGRGFENQTIRNFINTSFLFLPFIPHASTVIFLIYRSSSLIIPYTTRPHILCNNFHSFHHCPLSPIFLTSSSRWPIQPSQSLSFYDYILYSFRVYSFLILSDLVTLHLHLIIVVFVISCLFSLFNVQHVVHHCWLHNNFTKLLFYPFYHTTLLSLP